ncbi:HIT family protein [Methanocrinis sp.]|uniref:HIT family protein n=1 Tax=Methanocrinis sp. TaxID=3101522 RepID=UPI003D142EAD
MDSKKENSCIFCEIVAERAKAQRIYEDDLSLAILDINPFSKGHCLVVPKRHVPWWHDLTEEEVESLFRVARETSQKIMKAFSPDFVAMYARGRRIPHTHIFVVPTYGGDVLDRFFNALEGFQEATSGLANLKNDEELEEAADLLRSA